LARAQPALLRLVQAVRPEAACFVGQLPLPHSMQAAMLVHLVLAPLGQALLDSSELGPPATRVLPREPGWRASFAPALLRQQTPAPRQI
jgi:hypothetical protein